MTPKRQTQGYKGGSNPLFIQKPGSKLFSLFTGLTLSALGIGTQAQAETISVTEGFSTPTLNGFDYTTTFTPGSPFPFPASVSLDRGSGETQIYSVTVDINGPITNSSVTLADPMFNVNSDSGPITVNTGGSIQFDNVIAPNDPVDSIGTAAIFVLGKATAATVGANITVNHSGSLTVNGVDSEPYVSVQLNPLGLRTAELSGIQAVSFGDQSSGHTHTWAGGNIQVTTTDGSSITMTQVDDSAITAGISAASAAGPGSGFGNSPLLNMVNVDHHGKIEVNAGSGAGIFATTTGAQNNGSMAVGGPIQINLHESTDGTSIKVNDQSAVANQVGIGVFAVSTAYALNEASKGSDVSGGHVEVDLDANTSISVGGTDSLLSIGILAVSSGTDALINPFSSQTVSKTGSGFGGEVVVNNTGSITTRGKIAIGIAALSLGGAAQVTSISGSSGQSSYVGSSGTSDGVGGGTVTVDNKVGGIITTLGEGAHGILAISSASGGLVNNDLAASGTSAPAVTPPVPSTPTTPSSPSNLTPLLTGNWEEHNTGLILGNSASEDTGHNGGEVSVTNEGVINTGDGSVSSKASIAILAQSIGGGGGNAGGDKTALFIGDEGGKGGNGGFVTVNTNSGSMLKTFDENSIGILTQSIGGGGGNGANAKGFYVAVGGRGGSGGDGGTIILDHAGSLITLNDYASGIIAQSIGGGGGHGGTATAITPIFAMGIGGKGGTGGNGGAVTSSVESSGDIRTYGNNSAAMHLQSVGGGGGTGGASMDTSAGPLAITIAVGGHGGAGGHGGTVSANNYGTITTGIETNVPSGGAPTIDGSDSMGIIAQSIGGGGGQGGSAIAKSVALGAFDDLPAVSFDLSLGGYGGTAGNGGEVDLTNTGTITTWGDGSHAILAQSIGGGGGAGGDSTASATVIGLGVAEVTIAVAHGGNGGGAGSGGDLILTTASASSIITTHGQNAAGIVAQSIGGGGGNGGTGNAQAQTPNLPVTSNIVTNLGLGGKAGGGGDSGFINLTNGGAIVTTGSGSQGILAQAIGGGGGNAGGGMTSGGNNTYEFDITVGGTGGSGGSASVASNENNGDSIRISNNGSISTSAGDATGIHAQSIGGGGGNAGTSDVEATTGYFANITNLLSPTDTYAATLTIGGHGGSGGEGGKIDIDNVYSSSIATLGTRSHGIFAQSISGGGGTGGSANATSNSAIADPLTPADENRININFSVNIAVGGKGGSSHAGGEVDLGNEGSITTEGYSSHAMFAQSIGGGGGVGADGSLDTKTTLSLGVNVNGASGNSGSGGTINIGNTGSIVTSNNDSYGVFAQSIGGGGGLATQGTDITFTDHNTLGYNPNLHAGVSLGINMSNDTAVNGGTIAITNGVAGGGAAQGKIQTEGDWSMGIVAQSIGGGGGKAGTVFGTNSQSVPDLDMQLGATRGFGNGNTVKVTLNSSGVIETGSAGDGRGFAAYGIVAQSIGGGGGLATDGSSTATGVFYLGGETEHVTGSGETVTLEGVGTVHTSGEAAHGVILQSVGGGGGIAGTGSSQNYSGDISGYSAPSIYLGGSDSVGNGGEIKLSDTQSTILTVSTAGENAFGVILQSVGGGGGIATAKQTGGEVLLGRTGNSDTQDGGEINATLSAGSSIITTGSGSHGIVAQSIGGGGGIANPDAPLGQGTIVNTTYNSSAYSAHGHGNNVNLDIDSTITTSGAGANGILAQVIGGGGGLYGNFAGSTGNSNSSTDGDGNGTLSIIQSGSITTSGNNSIGIFAQNVTGNGNRGNNISITVNGSIQSTGTAISVDGGKSNTLTVNTGGSVTSTVTQAIFYHGTEGLNVTNHGTVTGTIDLGNASGANVGTFTNESDGVLNTGSALYGQVKDSGTTVIGGEFTAAATGFTEKFTQNSGALLKLEIFSPTGYDHMDFSGAGYGDFNGSMQVMVYDSGFNLQVGEYITLISGATGNIYGSEFLNGLSILGLGEGVDLQAFIGTDKSFYLEVMTVPEPTTWALLVLGLFFVGYGVRRKTAKV